MRAAGGGLLHRSLPTDVETNCPDVETNCLDSGKKTFILMRAVPTECCSDPENSMWEAGKFHEKIMMARIRVG